MQQQVMPSSELQISMRSDPGQLNEAGKEMLSTGNLGSIRNSACLESEKDLPPRTSLPECKKSTLDMVCGDRSVRSNFKFP